MWVSCGGMGSGSGLGERRWLAAAVAACSSWRREAVMMHRRLGDHRSGFSLLVAWLLGLEVTTGHSGGLRKWCGLESSWQYLGDAAMMHRRLGDDCGGLLLRGFWVRMWLWGMTVVWGSRVAWRVRWFYPFTTTSWIVDCFLLLF
jgi:hypothetical protein